MKKIKQLKGWHIYKNNEKEENEYGFSFSVIPPELVGCECLSPSDSDIECQSLEDSISWINNY